jgi:hypothetical protein
MQRPNARGDYAQIWAPGFDWREYLDRQYDPRLLRTAEGRRAIGRLDPFAFALIYFRHQLTGSGAAGVTFSPFHAASYEWALSWVGPQSFMGNRHSWAAPRGSAKSTLHFRILPTWASCYLHRNYFSIFTRTSELAGEHMQNGQNERRTNPLLINDFPKFCTPRKSGRMAERDTLGAYLAESGAVITAKGMDASVLGSSIDGRRADVLVFDDVENSESNYTPEQAEKRKSTITNAIGLYNTDAIWSWVGTTTMYHGLQHQLVLSAHPEIPVDQDMLKWIREQRITAHHFRPLIDDPAGSGEKVSMWPGRWRTEDLKAIQHTRTYRMEMDNLPSLGDEGMWQEKDFTYATEASADDYRCALFVDPAVTVTATSDYSGLAVVQYPFPSAAEVREGKPGHVEVLHVERRKATGRALRDRIMQLISLYPQIKRVVVERNQGGSLWTETFAEIPVEVELIQAKMAKEVRAAHALTKYQARPSQVWHIGRHAEVEDVMQSFPLVPHDDDVDAVVYGVLYWLSPGEVRDPKSSAAGRPATDYSESYV